MTFLVSDVHAPNNEDFEQLLSRVFMLADEANYGDIAS
jgi:hypothetical protein